MGSDRWPLASLAVAAGGFGRVQPALLCHGPAAAAAAEGDRGPELVAQTLPRRRPRVLDFSCQRRWAPAHGSANEAAQGPGCWWTRLKAPRNKPHQGRAARILSHFHMDKRNQEIQACLQELFLFLNKSITRQKSGLRTPFFLAPPDLNAYLQPDLLEQAAGVQGCTLRHAQSTACFTPGSLWAAL